MWRARFPAVTDDRLVHLLVALGLCGLFLRVRQRNYSGYQWVAALSMAGLASWVPDWDLFLGIGFHRSPITHSVLPALAIGWLILKLNAPSAFLVGFLLGLSSHLLWDIVDYGNVVWIPGGNNDRLFLLVNSLLLLVAAAYYTRSIER